jgi:hypothetical protein
VLGWGYPQPAARAKYSPHYLLQERFTGAEHAAELSNCLRKNSFILEEGCRILEQEAVRQDGRVSVALEMVACDVRHLFGQVDDLRRSRWAMGEALTELVAMKQELKEFMRKIARELDRSQRSEAKLFDYANSDRADIRKLINSVDDLKTDNRRLREDVRQLKASKGGRSEKRRREEEERYSEFEEEPEPRPRHRRERSERSTYAVERYRHSDDERPRKSPHLAPRVAPVKRTVPRLSLVRSESGSRYGPHNDFTDPGLSEDEQSGGRASDGGRSPRTDVNEDWETEGRN